MILRIMSVLADDPMLSLKKLSDELGIHRKQIQLLVKTATKKPFREVKKICRMCHSVRLLKSSGNVKGVAFDCGYAYPKNYARVLKKHFGISPSAILKVQTDGGMRAQLPFLVRCPFNINICPKKYHDMEKRI